MLQMIKLGVSELGTSNGLESLSTLFRFSIIVKISTNSKKARLQKVTQTLSDLKFLKI
jgi:hypothetical protein